MTRNLPVIFLALFLVGFGDTAYFDNKKGNRLYEEQKYNEAVEAYSRAKNGNKSEKGIDYNLGNSLFRTGDYGKAIESFSAATETEKAALKENAMFNLGAAHYKAGEKAIEAKDMESAGAAFKGSVDQYKNLLALKPGDDDARHNLELAIEKLKMLEQQKQQQDKKEKSDKDENSEDKKEESQSQGDDGKEKDDSDKRQENENNKKRSDEDKNDDQQKQGKKEEPKEGMTPEKAQRILDAIENDEKELREKIKAVEAGKQPPVEKDW